MDDLISRQAALDAIEERLDYLQMLNKAENPTAISKWYGINWARNTIAELPSAQPEQPLLKIIQDFKVATGCKDILVVQKDAMKAWDENGVAYTMQPERKKGEWERTSFYNDTPICSECYLEGRWDWDFCPNCGADMRGEQND